MLKFIVWNYGNQPCRRATGFQGRFHKWWPSRATQLQGSPLTIPGHVPTTEVCQALFVDFQINYKKFERWHFRQRQDLLATNLAQQKARLFASVKEDQKPQLTHLEERKIVDVTGVSDDGAQLQVSKPLTLQELYEIQVSSIPLQVYDIAGDILTVDDDTLILPGTELEVIQHYATPPQLHDALARFGLHGGARSPIN